MPKILLPPAVGMTVRAIDWFLGNTVMRLAAGGGFFEAPQQTHAWNNHVLLLNDIEELDKRLFANEPGCPTSIRMPMWRAHCPIFGGWRRYVVLWQKEAVPWRIGWCGSTFAGISSIILKQPYVRVLVGPDDTSWFALRDHDGEQLPLSLQGRGVVGNGRRPWGHIMLL